MVVDLAAMVIRQAESNFTEAEKLQVMLGALCHDLGKPCTTELLDGRIRSRGHESAGEEPTKELLERWTFGQVIEHGTIMCVREHLKPGMLQREFEHGMLDEKKYTNAVRTLLRRIAPTSWRVLLAVAEADWRGRGLTNVEAETYPYAEHFSRAVASGQLEDPLLKTLLHGRDVLALGVQPGPRVGELIQQIEAARDRGEIETKEQALETLRQLIERSN
jgi:tRNA nucleotidyltransferase (CCA-adding enzyme)